MNGVAPPLRFLVLAVGGWVGLRAAMIVPGWWIEEGAAAPVQARTAPATAPATAAAVAAGVPSRPAANLARGGRVIFAASSRWPILSPATLPTPIPQTWIFAAAPAHIRPVAAETPVPPFAFPERRLAAPSRWSGSAWLLLRRDEGSGLAPGGTLGGSQAGARLAFRVAGSPRQPLALTARLYVPLERRSGAEAALGFDWRPSAAVPVHIVAERRQALGRDGRSAFSVFAYGGVSGRRLPAGLRLDAFGQAGVVGTRSRDVFADGSARVTAAVGRFDLGAGLWGGAQPGASRLDAGPHASVRLPLAGQTVRLSAEWRFRIAGEARPGSGPALGLGTDF